LLSAETIGEIEKEDGILIIKRIHVIYHLKIDSENREKADRVHEVHADYCPVARSINGCIEITTELRMSDV
tara:strand:- start:389 stop:601 length:213 start_codon:yes stop_codon:yes gene_type:complete